MKGKSKQVGDLGRRHGPGEEPEAKREHKPPIRLERGYGTIRYIGAGRQRPYAVHPPGRRVEVDGKIHYQRAKAICYVEDWYTGFAVLTAWHAGTYYPGMEQELREKLRHSGKTSLQTKGDLEQYLIMIQKRCLGMSGNHLLASAAGAWREKGRRSSDAWQNRTLPLEEEAFEEYMETETSRKDGMGGYAGDSVEAGGKITHERGKLPAYDSRMQQGYTIQEVFERFYEYKFGVDAPHKLSTSTARNTRVTFQKLAGIADRSMDSLTVDELQQVVNGVRLRRAMVSKTVLLIKELYRYALPRDLCSRNPAQYIRMPDTAEYVHHQDFTDEELMILWSHQQDKVVRMILMMCYTGFRISAYETLTIHLEEGYFQGGIKTKAGKNRIVPIHPAILPIAREWAAGGKAYLSTINKTWFSRQMKRKLREIGIDQGERHHSPHSCRHTFSRLCESYGVREADRKRLLGHSFGEDLTNGVYGHRSLEELRHEIEKIQVPSG